MGLFCRRFFVALCLIASCGCFTNIYVRADLPLAIRHSVVMTMAVRDAWGMPLPNAYVTLTDMSGQEQPCDNSCWSDAFGVVRIRVQRQTQTLILRVYAEHYSSIYGEMLSPLESTLYRILLIPAK